MKRMNCKGVLSFRGAAVLFCFFLSFFVDSFAAGAFGTPYIRNFSRQEYDQHPQNWAIGQDKRGVIYIGNNGGLMEYDGVSWRTYLIPGWAVRSLAIDDTGIIYIGGIGEIGYFVPEAGNNLKYVSLMEHLKKKLSKDQLNFGYVRRTYITKKGVYFWSEPYLFRWDGQDLAVLPCRRDKMEENIFNAMSWCNNTLFVCDKAAGLMQVKKGKLATVPGGEKLKGIQPYTIAPHGVEASGKTFIATREGCFLYDGTGVFPFETEVDDYLKNKLVYYGVRLSSGDYALGTESGGLVIMDQKGGLKRVFDDQSVLQSNVVRSIFEDFQGNLWLGLGYGITKIEYRSPISRLNTTNGLPPVILSVARLGEKLYAGTTTGLYYMPSPGERFRMIPEVRVPCWSLLAVGDSILAAANNGVYHLLPNGKTNKIRGGISYVVGASSRFPGRVWVGQVGSLHGLEFRDGNLEEILHLKVKDEAIRTLKEDANGGLWLGPLGGGVIGITFPSGGGEPALKKYDQSSGLCAGEIRVFKADGRLIFGSQKGIYRYSEKEDRFVPDGMLGNDFRGGSGRIVFQLAQDKNRNIWFHSEGFNYRAIFRNNGTYLVDDVPFLRLPRVQTNVIYPNNEEIWLGGNDELIRFEDVLSKNYMPDFKTLVRRVTVNGNEVIYDGEPLSLSEESAGPVLQYSDRNLRFSFAALFFEDETSTRYRWFLEGYDDGWSGWRDSKSIDYTNLPPGEYTFRVEGRSVYQFEGRRGGYRFSVLPPWYLTWWMLGVYGGFVFFVLYGVVKWRSHRLVTEKLKLEGIIKERTREIAQSNRQLEEQAVRLQQQSEKLQEMDTIKSRFFANISHEFRTPLTLILGPLERLFEGFDDQWAREEFGVMRRNAHRLLTLINQLLDLSKLDSGKMSLKVTSRDIVHFLQGVVGVFEGSVRQSGVELVFQAPGEAVFFYFDGEKMEEVICNLLSNAFKYTPSEGRITLTVRLIEKPELDKEAWAEGLVEISVADTGLGIPRDKIPYIFDRFYQAEKPESKMNSANHMKHVNHKSTGIGLALVRELVHLHGGVIDVSSRPGEGTEFVLRFPKGKKHLLSAGVAEIVEMEDVTEQNNMIENRGEVPVLAAQEDLRPAVSMAPPGQEMSKTNDTAGPGAAEKTENGDGKREKNLVLVVEDNSDMRRHICQTLKQEYRVEEAENGETGLARAQELIPDLIVSDVMMPGLDGYALCSRLKGDIKTSHIPVIMLTAKSSDESVVEGLGCGADDYITKPFSGKILNARVENLVRLRGQLQERAQREMLLQPEEIKVSSMDREFIEELQGVIEKNLGDPDFNVDALGKKLLMSRASLYRKIRALSGEAPGHYIRSYRLKRAAQLLREKFGTISQIAFEVGFSNNAYFTQCFKEQFDRLPSEYQATESV